MNFKKAVLVIVFLIMFGWLFGAGNLRADTMSIPEMRDLISRLRTQIIQLQEQIAKLLGKQTTWCHDFDYDLKYGDTGTDDIGALKIALNKEGLFSEEGNTRWPEPYYFDERIASAVTAFQEKYKDDILLPLGLQHGTGVAGRKTRNKLNALYGCKELSYSEGITNGSFEKDINGWTATTKGNADTLWDNGKLRLRIYRCSNVEAKQTFIVNGDKLSFDWWTKAEGWYEMPGWELLIDGKTVTDEGLSIDRAASFSGKKELDVSIYKGKTATLKFRIFPSTWCYMGDHSNTYLWIDNVELKIMRNKK